MMICLSKNLADTYVNMLAAGANLPLYNYDYFPDTGDLLIRSMAKAPLIKQCWRGNRTFFYMDGGYFGNYPSTRNPYGDKHYHRIVKNNLQHTELLNRPSDRWDAIGYKIKKRKPGNHILLVLPSEKPCKFYGIDLHSWIQDTIQLIKLHTDRPIIVRTKGSRRARLHDSIFNALDTAHATVTYNSVAAVESILEGVPVIPLAPSAASPVSEKQIVNIENPFMPDPDLVYTWASGLAYGQYHIDELKDGSAYKLIYEYS